MPADNKKVFVEPTTSTERKPEPASIFIKKDYLPSPIKQSIIKTEKTRDEVTRMLNFNCTAASVTTDGEDTTESIIKVESADTIRCKKESTVDQVLLQQIPPTPTPPPPPPQQLPPPAAPLTTITEVQTNLISSISDNKENSNKDEYKINYLADKKVELTIDETSTKQKIEIAAIAPTTPKTSSAAEKKSTSDKHIHASTSIRSTAIDSNTIGNTTGKEYKSSSSSSRRSSSSSNRECSRCYKRSKIKRTNVGVQCKRQQSDQQISVMQPTIPAKTCVPYPIRDLNCTQKGIEGLKYERFFHIEVHSNGGASVVHMYQDEINNLPKDEMDELVDEFFKVAFSEDAEGNAHHVMGIVHDAAAYLPDLLEHMSENYSTLTVKAGVMGRNSDIETSTMYQYNEQVNF